MSQRIADRTLSQLSEFIVGQMGLYFPVERWRDLERGITSAAREFDFREAEACAQWLLSAPLTKRQIEILARHLTVGETYFFRDTKSFEVLREQVLPELIRSRQQTEPRLRIWSAGCCTGAEPYSLAILLSQMIPDLPNWNLFILATDINPGFLQEASAGVYSKWSFRGTPHWVQERYFKKTADGNFEILPQIKKMVMFSYLNLAEASYPSLWNQTNAMDLILCRNVLMYFAPERAQRVILHLHRSLVEGGWLLVSPSELSHARFSSFVTVTFPGAIFYRKDSSQAHRIETVPERIIKEPMLWSVPDAAPDPQTNIPLNFDPPAVEELQESETPFSAYQEAKDYYARGYYAEATERLLASLLQEPENAAAMALLARAAANQGQLAEALQWCEKAIVTDKLSKDCHYLRAVILQERGESIEAEAALKRALYLDPNFALAYFALGNLTLQQGKPQESLKHFRNALSLLQAYRPEDTLPGSEGITAGRLVEVIRSAIASEK